MFFFLRTDIDITPRIDFVTGNTLGSSERVIYGGDCLLLRALLTANLSSLNKTSLLFDVCLVNVFRLRLKNYELKSSPINSKEKMNYLMFPFCIGSCLYFIT